MQRDMRNPEMVFVLRRFASRQMRSEGIRAIVVISDGTDGCCDGQDAAAASSLMLIGKGGNVERFEMEGELPAPLESLGRNPAPGGPALAASPAPTAASPETADGVKSE